MNSMVFDEYAEGNLSGASTDEWSGLAYFDDGNAERLIAINDGKNLAVFDQAGGNVVVAQLSGFHDTEGIVHIDGNTFAILEERSTVNNDPHVSIVEIDVTNITSSTTISKPTSTTPDPQTGEYYFSLGGTALDNGNLGPEGTAYVPAVGQDPAFFYIAKERAAENQQGQMFTVDLDGSNLSQITTFPVPSCVTNFSDIFYQNGSLYVISENGGGQDVFRVNMSASPLSVSDSVCNTGELPENIEGFAMNGDGTKFFVVTDEQSPDFRAFVSADINGDGNINTQDFSVLGAVVNDENNVSTDNVLDLNDDGIVDVYDLNFFVHRLLDTVYGDSNLDGQYNSSDHVLVFQAGEYEDNGQGAAYVGNSTWEEGDWNGDGDFTTADFVVSFEDGAYEQGTSYDPAREDYNPNV